MSPKHALLVAAIVAVLGLGVYLFIQVKATPPAPHATQVTQRETHETHDTPAPTPSPSRSIDGKTIADIPKPGSSKPLWQRTPPSSDDTPASVTPEGGAVNLKLDNLMELANKAYDSQDFDQAVAIAGKVLDKDPGNVRMLRILVSANCIQGDSALAQQNYEKLPAFDREQMKARCDRYGVTFKDPP